MVALIDRGSASPRMVSVSILEYIDEPAAQDGPEQLKQVIDLMASRFAYTPEGTKRTVRLRPDLDVAEWMIISAKHPGPGGGVMFGSFGLRPHDRFLLIVNQMDAAKDQPAVSDLLRSIDKAF
ncbi:MAG: hypothetical protein AB8F26_04290 [Phycisphaerales bacterium]